MSARLLPEAGGRFDEQVRLSALLVGAVPASGACRIHWRGSKTAVAGVGDKRRRGCGLGCSCERVEAFYPGEPIKSRSLLTMVAECSRQCRAIKASVDKLPPPVPASSSRSKKTTQRLLGQVDNPDMRKAQPAFDKVPDLRG